MKLRLGFVSNSSNTSFTVLYKNLNKEQIEALVEFEGSPENYSDWDISVDNDGIHGCATDAYPPEDIEKLFEKINIDHTDDKVVEWWSW